LVRGVPVTLAEVFVTRNRVRPIWRFFLSAVLVVLAYVGVGIALDDRQAAGDAFVDALLADLDAAAVDAARHLEKLQELSVAAADVEDARARLDQLGDRQMVDPGRDREIINIELGLADLATIEKRLDKTARTARSGDPQAKLEQRLLERVRDALAAGRPARSVTPTDEEAAAYRTFNLLTAKPVLYAANVGEDEIGGGNRHTEALRAAVERDGESAEIVTFSAKVEAELAELAPEDRKEFLDSLGVTESGLDRLAHAAYHLLGLQSYFTAGEKEVRAWTIHRGDKAPTAAGAIHSDFEKGFIRAETVAYDDFVRVGGWKPAREQGLSRAEGKEYVVQDGDVMLFRFS